MKMTQKQGQVKVDWDDKEPPNLFNLDKLLRRAGYNVVHCNITPSPSGNGWHVRYTLYPRPTSPYEVVALQAILGSDPHREAMQMNRARAFEKAPTWMRNLWNVLYLPHPHRQRHLTLENRNGAESRNAE